MIELDAKAVIVSHILLTGLRVYRGTSVTSLMYKGLGALIIFYCEDAYSMILHNYTFHPALPMQMHRCHRQAATSNASAM
jgi:hypothetical protein